MATLNECQKKSDSFGGSSLSPDACVRPDFADNDCSQRCLPLVEALRNCPVSASDLRNYVRKFVEPGCHAALPLINEEPSELTTTPGVPSTEAVTTSTETTTTTTESTESTTTKPEGGARSTDVSLAMSIIVVSSLYVFI